MVRAAIAAAALVAIRATAINTHRHNHRELAEQYARLQWERAIEERALVYKYTKTEIVTETVVVTVMVDPPQDVPPTGIFFESCSSSAEPKEPAPQPPTFPNQPVEQPVNQQPKPFFEMPAKAEVPAGVPPKPPAEVPIEVPPKPPAEVPIEVPAKPPAEVPIEVPAKPPAEVPLEAPANPPSLSSPPSGGSRLPCKRGIAYNNPDIPSLFTSSGNVCWGYDWGSGGFLGDFAAYVPMLWGKADWSWNTFDMNMASQMQRNPMLHNIFSFNEPDLPGQARDLIPTFAEAARLHIDRLTSYFDAGYAVGAPAVTSNVRDPTMSLTYLENFISTCNSLAGGSCPISFVNVHYYEFDVCDSSGLVSFIEQVMSRFPGYPIWVTEYQLVRTACSGAEKAAFIEAAAEYMNENAMIEAYAYFYADGDLTEAGGSAISDLGRAYIGI